MTILEHIGDTTKNLEIWTKLVSRTLQYKDMGTWTAKPLLEIITKSDLRRGLEFDCNQEATLGRGARPLKDFNSGCIWRLFPLVMQPFKFLSFKIIWKFSTHFLQNILINLLVKNIYNSRVMYRNLYIMTKPAYFVFSLVSLAQNLRDKDNGI